MTVSWRQWLRRLMGLRSRRVARGSRPAPELEPLEDRVVPAITTTAIPAWVDQGPGPMINAQLDVPSPDPVGNPAGVDAASGAVRSIATHPNQPTHLLVGTVGGGVWRATNANTATPATVTWTALGDNLGTLAIGAVAYDTADATGNTFYAGAGDFSNSFDGAGRQTGLYRTTDAGANWTLLGTQTPGGNPLVGLQIKSIVVIGTTILVGGVNPFGPRDYRLLGGALWRSTDGGLNFTREVGVGATDLPNAAVASIVQDPNAANTVYAALPGRGVYRSTDGGDIWTQVNTGLGLAGTESIIELAVEDNGATTTVYAAVATGAALNGVFSTTDAGANWAALPGGLPAAFNSGPNFAEKIQLIVDPDAAGVVYIAGQGGGAAGDAYRYNPGGGGSWTSIFGANANASAPHVDSHDMRFFGNNTLVYAGDGGLYFLNNPDNIGANQWQSFNGVAPNAIRAVEFFAVAYDPNGDRIMGGSQDNGSEIQTGLNNQTWDHVQDGDGQNQEYDATNNLRYSLGNNFGNFGRNGAQLQLRANGNPANFSGLRMADQPVMGGFTGFESFIPFILNSVDPTRILLGRVGLYESDPAAITPTGDVIIDITPGGMGQARSLAYGGRRAGMNFVNVAFVGTTGGQLFYRPEGGGAFINVSDGGMGELGGAGAVEDIVLDPQDWRRVYVLRGDQIWLTNNVEDLVNNPFAQVTDNLGDLTDEVRSIELYDVTAATAGDSILLAGGYGGVFRRLTAVAGGCDDATWSEYGQGLPNVLVQDVRFSTDDVDGNALSGIGRLIAGTMGRGAWTIDNVSATVATAGVLTVTGDAGNNAMFLRQDQSNPNRIVVSDGLGNTATFDKALFQEVRFLGQGGGDTIRVDSTGTAAGDVDFVTFLVAVDAGGDANDALLVNDAGDGTNTQLTITANQVGAAVGMGDTFFGNCGVVNYFGLQNGTLDINLAATGTPTNNVFIESISAGATNVTGGPGRDNFRIAGGSGLNLAGQGGNDFIFGPDAATTWNVTAANAGNVVGRVTAFTSVENLTGNNDIDEFVFNNGNLTGAVVGGAGPGVNRVTDQTNRDNDWMIDDLDAGDVAFITGGFTQIQSLTGGPGADVFTFTNGANVGRLGGRVDGDGAGGGEFNSIIDQVPNRNNTWTVTAANEGTVGFITQGFEDIQNLTGSTGTDQFTFTNDAARVDGVVNGGLGAAFNSITDLSSRPNVWGVDQPNGGTVGFVGQFFRRIQNLNGSTGVDQFLFLGPTSRVDGRVDGGDPNNNVLADFSARANVWGVTLPNQGTVGFVVGGFARIQTLVGSTGVDQFVFGAAGTLTGFVNGRDGSDWLADFSPTRNNTWALFAPDTGTVGFLGVGFNAVENLVGSFADDVFLFGPNGSLTGLINGQTGQDWLDYVLLTIAVRVDLSAGTASRAGSVFDIEHVRGGAAGNSVLRGNDRNNILVTFLVNNQLFGMGGRDVQISGIGKNLLDGGGDDDLLIGGRTTFDQNNAALLAIAAEWGRPDLAYDGRVANLRVGGGLAAGNPLIVDVTVFVPFFAAGPQYGRGGGERTATLIGGPGRDWFFTGLLLATIDPELNEAVN